MWYNMSMNSPKPSLTAETLSNMDDLSDSVRMIASWFPDFDETENGLSITRRTSPLNTITIQQYDNGGIVDKEGILYGAIILAGAQVHDYQNYRVYLDGVYETESNTWLDLGRIKILNTYLEVVFNDVL